MWQPSCTLETIKARAELNAQIRAFFHARSVLEVETPVLSHAGSTDPCLDSLRIEDAVTLYLQTSPEFSMKRLLAAGSGDIYQLCKSFRRNEIGGRHNPEFTMLEWYRVGFSLVQLMEEIEALVCSVLGVGAARTVTYKSVFREVLSLDPFSASESELAETCRHKTKYEGPALDRDSYLDLLISHCIEPTLGFDAPCFLTDYPASQASLARVETDEDGDLVGKRAELYVNGIELANAYDELIDADEQCQRFLQDRNTRTELGLMDVPHDERLVSALRSGIPACAGVALGVDRLLMLKLKASSLDDVLCFPFDRA